MEIKVIGTGCDKCDRLYENTQEALGNLGMEANVEKVEDLVEIVKLGVMTSPSLMVDGKLLICGREAKTREIEKLLSRA
ncbi:thioredoxin family protein [Intestinimonas butyriciproducens]|uniref:thioredoxin family protein n=1 Tax=Intestinimonas butyriciproducens TaxID=1297617 RepID=UPI0019594274|nr:thioredoxin family protein [Intestinimonas butyriciproducens]MBM6919492.1 TM0996/MTH895 family glutaredoxin-like protein [Intestinimonas butyriciproducens]